ncbi:unnamed protein product [Blepharisma stoltei]|uniref:VHS domain-containing protein n=1 Tax=Blepharisma stoltei TaxID=1481888 RepID=A0AAU9JIQ5_9CILI|nr:unnamed protein product [Blepharisma stoltei]
MKEDEINELIRRALTTIDAPALISQIAQEFSNAGYSPCRSLIQNLKKLIKSHQYSPTIKLQALKIIKACADTGNSYFLTYLAKKLASRFRSLCSYQSDSSDPQRGKTLFQSDSKSEQNASAGFLNLLLQCIEEWAGRFGADEMGRETIFFKIYMDLKNKGVTFPQIEPNDEENSIKMLLKSIKKLIENNGDISEVKEKLRTVKEFKRNIEKRIAESMEESNEEDIYELIVLNDEINDVCKIYKRWKSRLNPPKGKTKNFEYEPIQVKGVRFNQKIEEYEPKPAPLPDAIEDPIMVELANDKSQRQTSFHMKDLKLNDPDEMSELKEEYLKSKDKLLEYEDLIHMYKADLARLQIKYLEAVEEREEIKCRAESLGSANTKSETTIQDVQEKCKKLENEKASLLEEIEAFKSQNNCLKITIKEAQEKLLKAEEQINKHERYIESIEVMNENLTLKNEELMQKIKNASTQKGSEKQELNNEIPGPIPQLEIHPQEEQKEEVSTVKSDPWGIDGIQWLTQKWKL